VVLCICRSVTDRELEAAIRAGARSLDDVASACGGAGTDCGVCRDTIEERLSGPCGGGCPDCPRQGAAVASAVLLTGAP